MKLKTVTLLMLLPALMYAQNDDLFSELDGMTTEDKSEVIATFKSTRIMLGQSTERVRDGQLHFRISHVFSKIKGIDNFFGMDNLNNMQFSFEYGLTDYIQLGLLRSNSSDKTYSTSLKLSPLRQSIGDQSFPLSISYFGSVDYKSASYSIEERNDNLEGRLDFVNQVLISRKLGNVSLQLSPTWVHRNLTDFEIEPNDVYSVGIGGRYLFSRSVSVNMEYFYTIPTYDDYDIDKNAFTVGLDIETGGHVFQLYFTNAFALHPGKFALSQNGNFFKREINFGFSLLRAFSI